MATEVYADVYTSGPLKGRPFRASRAVPAFLQADTPPARGAVVHLTDADVDAWRDDVLFGGAAVGELDLNDAAIEAYRIPPDAPAPAVAWSDPAPSRSGGWTFVIFTGAMALYFAWRILATGGAA